MQPAPHRQHAHTPPPPPPPSSPQPASPDINIPPPNGAPPPSAETSPTQGVPRTAPPADDVPLAMSSTQLVIALVLILVWAGLLVFMRRLLTQSLVAQFADLGRARAAGTTLYVFLLVLGATVIVCALGGYWPVLAIMIPAAVLNAILLIIFLFSFAAARASRQRR